MKIADSRKDFQGALQAAKKAILAGEFIVYPTDTLYGLGANALDEKAVQKVIDAKARESKPISVVVADLAMLEKFFELTPAQREYVSALLPGPYTIILKPKARAGFAPNLAPDRGPSPPSPARSPITPASIGVRVPEHFFVLTLSKQTGLPITSTSANLSGEKAPTSVRDLDRSIAEKAALVVDGGPTFHGRESTVIDGLHKFKVLREGAGAEDLPEINVK